MNERMVRVRGGGRFRVEVRDDDGVGVVVLAFAPDGSLGGKARALRHRDDPTAADARVTLVGDGPRGLATTLLAELRRAARRSGIDRLTGQAVLGDGTTQRLLVASGAAVWLADPTTLAFEVPVRGRTVPPAVAQRRHLGRLAS